MKQIYLSLLASFIFSISFAQKGLPAFGKVDKADLEMKDCDFDKGADAVALIDYGNIYYDRGTAGVSLFKTVFERRTRIKILKEKGLSQANIEIPFYNHANEERVLWVNANTYNIDAFGKMQTTEVKKTAIYTKKIDGNYAKIIFTFPDVKVGSIIEYSYTVERETYNLRNWYFQGRIPVRYSEYQLKIPKIFRFTVQPIVFGPIEDKQDVITEFISVNEGLVETKSIKSNYVMRNLPGIKDEPFMGSAKDYMQRLEFQMVQVVYDDRRVVDLSVKWQDVVKKWLKEDEEFGKQLNKNVKDASTLVAAARQLTDTAARMRYVYNNLRKEMNWNNEEQNVYTDNGVLKTWETKTGNVADINLLLVNLLNDAGVAAVPVLFSTREYGLSSPTYTSVTQFNSVMAYVETGGRAFVLDATDKATPYTLIPEKVANTPGFIVEGKTGRWKDMLSGSSKHRVMTAIQGEVDETGMMKGTALINCYDYAKAQRAKEYTDNKQKFREDYITGLYPGIRTDDIAVNNLDADSLPLEQKFKFSWPLSNSGGYRYFSLNLFSELNSNPFIAENRVSDIDYGVNKEYVIFGNYTIPPGYVFDGIPANIEMTTPSNDIVFNRVINVEENLLNVRMSIEFRNTFYAADTYAAFREFYKKLIDKLNEQVVIKKK